MKKRILLRKIFQSKNSVQVNALNIKLNYLENCLVQSHKEEIERKEESAIANIKTNFSIIMLNLNPLPNLQ